MVSNGLGCPLGKGHLTLRGVLTYEWMSFFTCPCTPKFSLLPAYTVSFSLTCLRDSLAHISALTYAVLRFSDILKCTFQKWNLCFFFLDSADFWGQGGVGKGYQQSQQPYLASPEAAQWYMGSAFSGVLLIVQKSLKLRKTAPPSASFKRKLRHRGGLLVLAWKRSGFFQS